MIEAGIFDVGDVLHKYEEAPIIDDIIQSLGTDPSEIQRAISTFTPLLQLGKISEDDFWKKVVAQTGAVKPLPSKSLWLREFEGRIKPDEEVYAIVRKLKADGYKLAVLSNTIAPHAKFLTEAGIYNDFDTKVFSYEVGLLKPDPEIYLLTLQRLNVKPANSFFVDDKQKNVDAANGVGIHGILFTNPQRLEGELRSLGVKL